jgi:hypothetical protein
MKKIVLCARCLGFIPLVMLAAFFEDETDQQISHRD